MIDKKMYKICLSVLLTVLMIFGSTASVFAAVPSDVTGHWAEDVITEWMDAGLACGYPDNTFAPGNPVTRAEFMAFANRAFGFTEEIEITYKDVEANAWYAEIIRQAAAAGYISGYPDGTMRPNAMITRQEVAVILAKILALSEKNIETEPFASLSTVPEWSRSAVAAVAVAGAMTGYPDGSFKPLNNITRAEAVQALDNGIKSNWVINVADTYGPETGSETIERNVVVNAADVILRNLHVTGNLTITENVGDGDVTLNNITVDQAMFIRGGGTESIHISGGSYNNVIVESTPDGGTRIVAVDVDGLEITIATAQAGESVLFDGEFESIIVQSSNTTVDLSNARVDVLTVEANLVEVRIITGTTGFIKLAEIQSADVEIQGDVETIKTITGDGADTVVWPEEEVVMGGGGGVIVPPAPSPALTLNSVSIDGGSVPTTTIGDTVYYQIEKGWTNATPLVANVTGSNFNNTNYSMLVKAMVDNGMTISWTRTVPGEDMNVTNKNITETNLLDSGYGINVEDIMTEWAKGVSSDKVTVTIGISGGATLWTMNFILVDTL